MKSLALSGLVAVVITASAAAQTAVGGPATPFKDTSMLKPPAGAKVAIIEWEDLECPACARAFPIVHSAMKTYNVPLVRHDFQIPSHAWSHEASLYARYLQDKVSADLATEYRREVFASQYKIETKEDLQKFTQQFFATNKQNLPFVVDPTGALNKEVTADKDLGDKLGLHETPTIIVVTTKGWIQVKDVMQLYAALDQAKAMTAGAAPAAAPAKKPTTPTKKN